MQDYRSNLTRTLIYIRPQFTFLSVKNYINNFDELSDFSIGFHASYFNLVKRSLKIWRDFKITPDLIVGKKYSLNDLRISRDELISSYEESLTGHNHNYTCHDVYDLVNCEGKIVNGVKLQKSDTTIHLSGTLIAKRILKAGKYPDRHSASYTLAKNYLRSFTPLDKWRQFKLIRGKFESLSVEKFKMTPFDTDREKEK